MVGCFRLLAWQLTNKYMCRFGNGSGGGSGTRPWKQTAGLEVPERHGGLVTRQETLQLTHTSSLI